MRKLALRSTRRAAGGGTAEGGNPKGRIGPAPTSAPRRPRTRKVTTMAGKKVNLLVIASEDRPELKHLEDLPAEVDVLGVGTAFDENQVDMAAAEIVLLDSVGVQKDQIQQVFRNLPNVKWLHSNMAGLDIIKFPEMLKAAGDGLVVTNSKGTYSRSLAEYALFAAKYFALNAPRLAEQKQNKEFIKFPVGELAEKTMGIVGFGDIGRATGVLAKAYGMRIVATRRNPALSADDPILDECFATGDLAAMVEQCDYVVVSTPLTPSTKHIVDALVLKAMKRSAVLINVGRGPCVDEAALVEALKSGEIRGAGLDVFEEEPLPRDSELWGLRNVLISPHCADQVDGWLDNSIRLFVDQMGKYLRDGAGGLANVVDVERGY